MGPTKEHEGVFLDALERAPRDRAAFLERTCPTPKFRRQIEDMLRAHDAPDALLDEPAKLLGESDLEGSARPLRDMSNVEGALVEGLRVGRYKLLEHLGEGGMGVVFMAQEEEPIRRKVAIKFIRPGLASRHVVARFEAERQALAMMEHPCITRVFHADTTADGLPYFVMELVRGSRITDFCETQALSLDARLQLFVEACWGVHHAHQKGIIHRDLKPSNLLVTRRDGSFVPKIIDFGVAKAIDHTLTDKTLFTRFGDVVGTLDYMSPEQAEQSGSGQDTRSDIYSLGVVLYELVTGTTPLGSLNGVDISKAIEEIRSREPERPSTRISRTTQVPDVVVPDLELKTIREDVDWIVLKCLAKDRDERYETVAALARDIERYLAGEPTEAVAPTFRYQMRKLWRRHRIASSFVLTVAFMLLVWAATSVWFLIKYQRESRRASDAVQLAGVRLAVAEELRSRAEASEAELLQIERQQRYEIAYQKAMIGSLGLEIGSLDVNSDLGSISEGTISIESDEELALLDAFLNGLGFESVDSIVSSVLLEILGEGETGEIGGHGGQITILSPSMAIGGEEFAPVRKLLLEELRIEFGDRDPFVLQVLNQLGEEALGLEAWNEAEMRMREVIAIADADGYSVEGMKARLLLSLALAETERVERARALLAQVRAELGRRPAPVPTDLAELHARCEERLRGDGAR